MMPVLVGGIALTILGSQRVTKDFDFLISLQNNAAEEIAEVFYRHGFELVTKFNQLGEIVRTVDSASVAAIKLKSDRPQSRFGRAGSGISQEPAIEFTRSEIVCIHNTNTMPT